jgi:Tfp pilus assembly protein PilX
MFVGGVIMKMYLNKNRGSSLGAVNMFRNEKGIVLPMVIVIVAILTILGVALLGLSVSEAKQAAWQADAVQAQYLGQSGVSVGHKVLQYELSTNTFNNMSDVVTHMNDLVSTRSSMNPEEFGIAGVGTYSVTFEQVDALAIKIKSIGTKNNSNKTVTMTTRLSMPTSSVANPSDWVAGINLTHSITTLTNYLGQGVTFEGKPIQTPQGGNNPSIFQASVLLFTDYQGLSLRQINNSVDITFDTEILYFQTGAVLNGTNPSGGKNNISFGFSMPVGINRPVGRLAYTTNVGFEDVGRYTAFINGIPMETGFKNYIGEYSAYPFIAGHRYGIVRFGEDVTGYGTIPKGYYFYSSGIGGTSSVSLKGTNLITNNYLIPIKTDDILIKAVDSLFKYAAGSSDPQMWDNK